MGRRPRKSGSTDPPAGLHWIRIEWQAPGGPVQHYVRAWESIGLAVAEGPALVAMLAKGPHTIRAIEATAVGPDAWDYLNKRLRAEHSAKIAGEGLAKENRPASIREWIKRTFKRRE